MPVTMRSEGTLATRKKPTEKQTDQVLQSMLVFSKAVHHILETRAVEVAGEPLSASKVQILRLLQSRDAQTSTQIAQFLGVTRSAVTRLVTSLVSGGLVRRVDLHDDRRGFQVALTSKGTKVLERLLQEQRHVIRNAMERTAGADASQWADAMNEICEALVRSDEAFRKFCVQCGGFADGTCVLLGGSDDCLFLESSEKT